MTDKTTSWPVVLGGIVSELEAAHWYLWTENEQARAAIATAIRSLQDAARILGENHPSENLTATPDWLRVQALIDMLSLIADRHSRFGPAAPYHAQKLLRAVVATAPEDDQPVFLKLAHDYDGYRAGLTP